MEPFSGTTKESERVKIIYITFSLRSERSRLSRYSELLRNIFSEIYSRNLRIIFSNIIFDWYHKYIPSKCYNFDISQGIQVKENLQKETHLDTKCL